MSHRHGWPYEDPSTQKCTEVGPTVCLRPTVHGGDPDVTDSATGAISGGPVEHLAGFIVAYDWPGADARLEGYVSVDDDLEEKVRWTMTGTLQGGDLTLSPSIQAYDDQRQPTIHGFVQAGKWVPA